MCLFHMIKQLIIRNKSSAAEMTIFNVVGLCVLTQVGVASKYFPAGCASEVFVIMGVLAMFD